MFLIKKIENKIYALPLEWRIVDVENELSHTDYIEL